MALRFKPVVFVWLVVWAGGLASADSATTGELKTKVFGKTPDGAQVDLYTLTNSKGMRVSIATLGGIVVTLEVPDRAGRIGDVTLGFDMLEGYLKGHPYFGALIGRYGNRIGKGRFTLGGAEYTLARNNGENHLYQPCLLQPGRPGRGRCPRARALHRRRPIHAGGQFRRRVDHL